MKLLIFMACILMPVMMFNNINAMDNNINQNDNYQVNNNNIEDVLGNGIKVFTDGNVSNNLVDDDFIAYFGDTSKSNGIIEVNLWNDTDNNKVSIKNFFIDNNKNAIVKHNFFSLCRYDKKLPLDIILHGFAVIKHNNKYYLARYENNSYNLSSSWYLVDKDYESLFIGTTPSAIMSHIQDEQTIKKNAENMWDKNQFNGANSINKISKKIQRGTSANKIKLGPTILIDTAKFLRPLISKYKNSKDSKYIEEFCNAYKITNYFNCYNRECFDELLNDIDLFYKLLK